MHQRSCSLPLRTHGPPPSCTRTHWPGAARESCETDAHGQQSRSTRRRRGKARGGGGSARLGERESCARRGLAGYALCFWYARNGTKNLDNAHACCAARSAHTLPSRGLTPRAAAAAAASRWRESGRRHGLARGAAEAHERRASRLRASVAPSRCTSAVSLSRLRVAYTCGRIGFNRRLYFFFETLRSQV